MTVGTLGVLEGEAGDDRRKEAEIARLREMYEAPHAPEPELRPGPGEFAPVLVGSLGRATFRGVGFGHPDNAHRNILGPENYLG